MQSCASVLLDSDGGVAGDRYHGSSGKRHVTILQHEHLATIASLLHVDTIDPASLRRNLTVTGINLLALKGKQFLIGSARLEYTGLCHPCSRMEELLGSGGYNALRGHGGITARVLSNGTIKLNDPVIAVTGNTHVQT
ncbi:MAG: MOSC domain-containing protein [Granulosicoccus sp.]|nr:MOSC domain-containing protein [Granulosicoccus sp.]